MRDFGLIGNLHTAALVSRHGSIDWACLPRFASPSVFARILDPEKGGYARLAPVGPYRSRQRYLPSTCVLATEFFLSGGRRLELLDFFPIVEGAGPEGASLVVRRLRAVGGAVSVRFDCLPAFGYALNPHAWTLGRGRAVARAGDASLEVSSDPPRYVDGSHLRSEFDMEPGDPLLFEIAWGRRPKGLAPAEELLVTAKRYWRRWAHSSRAPVHRVAHRWHRWVLRSELTLKLLSHADTGAFVAAPTTSIPEFPGGVRNWDYRYVWIRDAAFAAQAMLRLGHEREGLAFLRWVLLRLRDDPIHRLRVVYGAHGERNLAEHELSHLQGMWDSRPVRVGNRASQQFQLDIYGELLDAAALLDKVDPAFVRENWNEVRSIAEVVVRRWRLPDRGIWEVRGPPQQFVHSKLMAWVALDRATRLARRHGRTGDVERWSNEAQKVRAWILSEGIDTSRATFRQAASSTAIDAANLRIPLVGFLPFDDKVVQGTIEAVVRELADGPFVYRYRAPDGLPGAEGAFLPASFWLVECLARSGQTELALRFWRRLLGAGNGLDLFSEEYASASRTMLGNFPQALTHIGILRAAVALGETTGQPVADPEEPLQAEQSGSLAPGTTGANLLPL